MRFPLPVLLTLPALAGCGATPAPSAPATVVEVAPIVSATHGAGQGSLAAPFDTSPRSGTAKRFLRLPAPGAKPLLARVAIEVPAAWGIRVRDAGGRALRPCQVSPSSPSELFVQARRPCDSPVCAEHEKIAEDLIRSRILAPSDIESKTAEIKGTASIARLTGHLGSREFRAFRSVQTDPQTSVPVACEAFLFQDEIAWQGAYEAACASLRPSPPDWQEGPDEIAAAPDGKPRTAEEERVSQAALDYVAALVARDQKAASALLFSLVECVGSGGAQDECDAGAETRKADLPAAFDRLPGGFVAGSADVRIPLAFPTFLIATIKPANDPCGPGYDITFARGDRRFAVISPEPVPDPRLAR